MENKKVADYAASVSEACFKKDGDQESTTPPKSQRTIDGAWKGCYSFSSPVDQPKCFEHYVAAVLRLDAPQVQTSWDLLLKTSEVC